MCALHRSKTNKRAEEINRKQSRNGAGGCHCWLACTIKTPVFPAPHVLSVITMLKPKSPARGTGQSKDMKVVCTPLGGVCQIVALPVCTVRLALPPLQNPAML